MKTVRPWLLCSFVVLFLAAAVRAGELPHARPDEVGISAGKLAQAVRVVEDRIDQKKFAGAMLVVAREGKIVEWKALGMMDLDKNRPMQPDAIFRIYSMTKPITTVSAMILWEEGKFKLDDPLSKYIPEFKGIRVWKGEGPADNTVPERREITIRDLMRHTSGFSYGIFSQSPVDALYRKAGLLARDMPLEKFATKLSKIPLLYQPGTKFHYSVSADVLGRLVEVISKKPLDEFFEERIFKPLDMVDTAFYVPASKASRFTTNYGPDKKGGLRVIDDPRYSPYLKPPKFFSGGGGLVSTARDYLRFCQMMLNGGELYGVRLLTRQTVEEMSRNQLPAEALPMSTGAAASDPGLGFGLGFGIRMAPSKFDPTAVPGEYFWGGAASTGFTICPRNQTVIITMTQFMPFTPTLAQDFERAVNAAVEPAAAHAAR